MARSASLTSTCLADHMEHQSIGLHRQIVSLQNELEEKIRESRLAAEVGFVLLQKNRHLQDQSSVLQEEIMAQSRIIREKEEQLDILRIENVQLIDKLNKNDSVLAQTEDIRISQNQTIQRMHFRIQKLEGECEHLNELRKENMALLSELNDQKDQLIGLFTRYNQLREQNKNHTRTIEIQKGSLEKMQNKVKKSEVDSNRLSQLEGQLRSVTQSNTEYANEIKSLLEENAQLKEIVALKDKEIVGLKEKSVESIFQFHARLNEAQHTIEELNGQLDMLQTTEIAASLSEELLLAKYGEVPEIGSVMTFLEADEQIHTEPECDISSGSDGHQDFQQTVPDSITHNQPNSGNFISVIDDIEKPLEYSTSASNNEESKPDSNEKNSVSAFGFLRERFARLLAQAWSMCVPNRAASSTGFVLIPIAFTIGLIVPYYSRQILQKPKTLA